MGDHSVLVFKVAVFSQDSHFISVVLHFVCVKASAGRIPEMFLQVQVLPSKITCLPPPPGDQFLKRGPLPLFQSGF